MSPVAALRDRRGLTLIELLLALMILAISGALVAGAAGSGLHAWRTGLSRGREELVARIVLERIATQLRAAVASRAEFEGRAAVGFDAGDDHLRFVTLGADAVPIQVSYALAGSEARAHLVYREHPWPDRGFFDGSNVRREESLPEVTSFTVVVERREDPRDRTGGGTTAAWSPLDGELPGVVNVEIAVRDGGDPEPRRWRITVQIPTRREGA